MAKMTKENIKNKTTLSKSKSKNAKNIITKTPAQRKKPGPKPGEGGRFPKKLDMRQLIKLCEMQCTQEEIAAVLGLEKETIDAKLKKDYGITFSAFYREKRKNGKVSLRRKIWLAAIGDDPKNNNIAIFLSKNYLGMSDRVDKTVISKRAKSNNQKRLEKLSNEELQAEIDKLKGVVNADSN